MSTTRGTGDENREARPIRTSTLADGSRLLAAFQVGAFQRRDAFMSYETDRCIKNVEGLLFGNVLNIP